MRIITWQVVIGKSNCALEIMLPICRLVVKYAVSLVVVQRLLASQQQEYGDRSGYTRQRIICESWIKHAYLSIAMLLLLI